MFITSKILDKESAAMENNKVNHETTSAVAAEWKYLIKKTFEASLKSNVIKVVITQKEMETFIQSPLYMALKVLDLDLIYHLLWIFLKKTKNPAVVVKFIVWLGDPKQENVFTC